jgi:PAS domain S-box-containing protein
MTAARKILIAVLLLLPVIFLAVFTTTETNRLFNENLYAERSTQANLSAHLLKTKLDHISELGLALASRPAFRALVQNQQWEAAALLLNEVPRDFQYVVRIQLLDSAGIVRSGLDAGKIHPGVDKGLLAFAGHLDELPPTSVTPVYRSAANTHPIVTAVRAVIRSNQIRPIGILLMEVDMNALLTWSATVSIGKNGYVYVVDNLGHVAASPALIPGDTVLDYSTVPVVRRALAGEKDVTIAYNPIVKQNRLSAFQPVPDYKWAVVVQQEASSALATKKNTRFVLVLSALMTLLSVFCVWLVLREMTRRKQLEQKLQLHNQELEDRVAQRTAALSKSEEALRTSENRFRSLIENSSDGIVMNDGKFGIVYQSPSVQRITGYTAEERAGSNVLDFVHPDYRTYVSGITEQVNASANLPIVFQYPFLHKDGHYIWLEGVVTNLLGEPSVKAIIANYRDVTERIEAEKKILASEKRYQALVEYNLEVTTLRDAQLRVIYRTPAAKRVTGWDDKDPELDSGELVHPDDREHVKHIITSALENPGHLFQSRFRYKHKKGHYIWMEGTVVNKLEDENVRGIISSFRDVSERINAEMAIEASEKMYRNLFENLLSGFAYYRTVMVNGRLTDAVYLAVNKQYERLVGRKDLVGCRLSEVIPGILESGVPNREIIEKVVSTGEPQQFESFAPSLNKWLAISMYSPSAEHFVALVDDISAQKDAESNIRKVNASLEEKVKQRTAELKKMNEELEAFSYSVSHDLRAPLRGILGFTSILEEEYNAKLDDEGRRITSIIKSNTIKMGELIDDLLLFSRVSRQELQLADIDTIDLVAQVIAEFNRTTPEKKIVWHYGELDRVFGDVASLRQVWRNLLSNAVKYSGNREIIEIEINSADNGEQIVFSVRDNGVGFDPRYSSKLFGVFQRLHGAEEFEGTGVGLAIVERIISKHGGKVWAEGEPDKGACFYFSIPKQRKQ